MKLSSLDYDLPQQLIAQEPLPNRSESRMLVLSKATGEIGHKRFYELPDLLCKGDLLVVNNTRVDALRLIGTKPSGGKVEVFLLKQLDDHEFECLLKPGKRLKAGSRLQFTENLTGQVLDSSNDFVRHIRLIGHTDSMGQYKGDSIDAELRKAGQTPLPPYIHQQLGDPLRYQTVYAKDGGSAAAPTAGLHFTEAIFKNLTAKGIEKAEVTLDVSLDTFRPVTTDDTSAHVMHGETCEIDQETCNKVAKASGKVIAVGTTSARTLESFAQGPRVLTPGRHETKIFIEPGYEWQIVDGLLTNFHLPRTTMLAMLASIAGIEPIRRAYQEAILHKYRFLSFGDCMLIL